MKLFRLFLCVIHPIFWATPHTNHCALPQAQLDTYKTVNYHWVEIQQNDAFSKTVKT